MSAGDDAVLVAKATGHPLVALLRDPARMATLDLRGWDLALRLARRANLIGWLAHQAQQRHLLDALPAPVQPHLVAALRLIAHQQQAIGWECAHLSQALAPLGVPLVLLKGAAYAMAGHEAAQGRLFGDVDLLVPREALNAVEAALMVHGWSTGRVDPYDQRYYREWMHELPPMAHQQRGTLVDVHHNILPLTARDTPDARPLLDASIALPGTAFRVLSPADMVIHSAVHLFHEGELGNGLRDLRDLAALLDEFARREPAFWTTLVARAEALGLAWPLLLALRYTRQVIGTEVPTPALQACQAAAGLGHLHLAWLDALYLRALPPPLPQARTSLGGLARGLLYLRSHALRMPPGMLVRHLGRKAVLRLFRHTSRSR